MTELTKSERRSIWRLIQVAKAKTVRPTIDPAINTLQDNIRREANKLERLLLAERMT